MLDLPFLYRRPTVSFCAFLEMLKPEKRIRVSCWHWHGAHLARCPGSQRLGGTVGASSSMPVSLHPNPLLARWPGRGLHCARSRAQDGRAGSVSSGVCPVRMRVPATSSREGCTASLACGSAVFRARPQDRTRPASQSQRATSLGAAAGPQDGLLTKECQQGTARSAAWTGPAWEGRASAGHGAQGSGESESPRTSSGPPGPATPGFLFVGAPTSTLQGAAESTGVNQKP